MIFDDSDKAFDIFLESALGWTSVNSLSMRLKDSQNLWTTTHLPFSLLPNVIPRKEFEKAKHLAPIFGKLVDRISRDIEWLEAVLHDVVSEDEFTKNLMMIYREVESTAVHRQPYQLGIHRSDYMLHVEDNSDLALMQIELNTIASSFGCMSALTSNLHRFLLERFSSSKTECNVLKQFFSSLGVEFADTKQLSHLLPSNPAAEVIPKAIAMAHNMYGHSSDSIVLFVVQPNETNIVDQKYIEHDLWEKHNIKVRRMTLSEIRDSGTVDERGQLRVGYDSLLVSVVYFRSGYSPNDYSSEKEWDARRMIELSIAIKCPTVGYQLAGSKKVQQALAEEGQVERFMPQQEAYQLRESFAGLWAANDRNAMERAKSCPHKYVLKPQREGGGNNLFGTELRQKLENSSSKELGSYILMQRLFPQTQNAFLVGRGQSQYGKTLSEWGIYSVFLGKEDSIELNEYAGHLVRTKFDDVDEGGVATGYSFLSSPIMGGENNN